jgi:hypothetical protein
MPITENLKKSDVFFLKRKQLFYLHLSTIIISFLYIERDGRTQNYIEERLLWPEDDVSVCMRRISEPTFGCTSISARADV